MSDDRRSRLKRWLESGEVNLQPLTFPQRELYEATPVPVADVANHICTFIQVRGVLAPQDCEAAVQRVVDRQEVLRLSFLPGKDRPVQMIRARSRAAIQFRDASMLERQPEAVEELLQETFREPFDLLQGPLYRVAVLRKSADDHLLVFAIHHAIADGWTLGVFVQDLCAAYALGRMRVPGGLPPVALSYSAWGAGERAFWQPSEINQHIPFWRSHLAGSPRLWKTPVDPDVAASPLQRYVSSISAELGRAVRELARRTGATLFSTLLAAFQVAISRWTGATDIIVGTPVANRSKQAIRETMGYCSGIVPIRGQVEHDRPFTDSLRAVHKTTVDCFAHAIPFAELVRELVDPPSPGHNPIFDVRFALQNHPVPDAAIPGLSLQLRMRSTGTARFHLGCEITESGDVLEVVWLFRPKMIPQEDIQELISTFEAVLAAACHSPDGRTSAFTT